MAARPRTLPAAVAPVLVGTALAVTERDLRVGGFIAALLGAIFIQVGTNLSNDYSDARRGADTEDRLGPVRVTAGGLVPPRQVLLATYVTFAAAVLCGVYLVIRRRAGAAAHRRRVDPRRRALHRRPAPVRLRGPRRGLRLPVLRRRRGHRLLLRAGRAGHVGGARARGAGRPAGRARSSSSTTCATSRPTAGPGSAPWPCASGDRARVRSTPRWSTAPSSSRRCRGCSGPVGVAAAAGRRSCRSRCRLVRTVRNHTDGPTLNGALARTGMLQLLFCVLLSIGLLLS